MRRIQANTIRCVAEISLPFVLFCFVTGFKLWLGHEPDIDGFAWFAASFYIAANALTKWNVRKIAFVLVAWQATHFYQYDIGGYGYITMAWISVLSGGLCPWAVLSWKTMDGIVLNTLYMIVRAVYAGVLGLSVGFNIDLHGSFAGISIYALILLILLFDFYTRNWLYRLEICREDQKKI